MRTLTLAPIHAQENFAAIEDVPIVPMGVAAVAGTGAIAAVCQVLLA